MINEEVSISEEIYQKALEFEDEDTFFGEDAIGYELLDSQQEPSLEKLTALNSALRKGRPDPFMMMSGLQ